MNVVVRADASLSLGSGHVMRCLTLATALRERGAAIWFICSERAGDLCNLIEECGFTVGRMGTCGSEQHAHSNAASSGVAAARAPFGGDWEIDANQTRAVIENWGTKFDCLIVDHYALDERWEQGLRGCAAHIVVIDDLADRAHDCDLLLDQNFDNPRHERYRQLVPARAQLLLGSRYALVRAEFLRHREAAVARRRGQLDRILVSMGGTDLLFTLGLGADFRISRTFDARFSAAVGDLDGVSLAAVWVH